MSTEKREDALAALRAAVQAKLAYWDAMNELEEAIGFPGGDVPDNVSNMLVDQVENFAAGSDDVALIELSHLDDLLMQCGVVL